MQGDYDEMFHHQFPLLEPDNDPLLPPNQDSLYLSIEPPNSYQLFQDQYPPPNNSLHSSLDTPNNQQTHPKQYINLDIYFSTIPKTSYNQETRQDKVNRYRLKKTKRVWKKKVSYVCRQDVAKHRPRIRGRFVSSKHTQDHSASNAAKDETAVQQMPAQRSPSSD